MSKQVSRFAATADSRGNAIDKGGVKITDHVNGRITEEVRLYRLDGTVLVTVRDVIAGTEESYIASPSELEEV